MEKSQNSDCTFEGKTYSHEEEVCIADKCMECEDGHWRVIDIKERGGMD